MQLDSSHELRVRDVRDAKHHRLQLCLRQHGLHRQPDDISHAHRQFPHICAADDLREVQGQTRRYEGMLLLLLFFFFNHGILIREGLTLYGITELQKLLRS